MTTNIPHWQKVHTIVFDFDGIFTNNRVYVDENGKETVVCSRADGLAFDILRRFIQINSWNLEIFILSKETNPVVMSRAKKMKIECLQSVDKKSNYIRSYLKKNLKNSNGLIYVGNDLNDLEVMLLPGVFSVAPSDSHPRILSIADCVLPYQGGESFIRFFIEALLRLDSMENEALASLL